MLICCCSQASELCSDTCARWRGTDGPDQVFNIPSWRKDSRGQRPTEPITIQAFTYKLPKEEE